MEHKGKSDRLVVERTQLQGASLSSPSTASSKIPVDPKSNYLLSKLPDLLASLPHMHMTIIHHREHLAINHIWLCGLSASVVLIVV